MIAGDLLISASMVIFGAYPLFLRFFPEIPIITFLFAFQVLGFIGFSFLVPHGQVFLRRWKDYQFIIALAVVAVANDLTYFLAFRLTAVSNAAIAHQMVSVFLLALSPLLLGEKTKRSEILALVFSLFGIGILYGKGVALSRQADLWGVTLGLASAVFYALVIILYRYLPSRGLNIRVINFWRYAVSAIILLPFMLSVPGFTIRMIDIAPLIIFGLVFAVVAAGIHTWGISKTRPLHASIIGKSEPVIASLYAFLLLGEIPSFWVIVGGLMIIGSSAWLAFRRGGEL